MTPWGRMSGDAVRPMPTPVVVTITPVDDVMPVDSAFSAGQPSGIGRRRNR